MPAECYRKGLNTIYNTQGSDVPCSETLPSGCCVTGSYCMEDGICRDLNPGNGYSGYYMQSCTDDTYGSSACVPYCTDQRFPDVVFNSTASLWVCCGAVNGFVSCNAPVTDETFSAPPPSILKTLTYLSSTTNVATSGATAAASSSKSSPTTRTSSTNTAFTRSSPSSHTTSTASTSPTAAGVTSSGSTSSSSSSLSAGTAAGIAVGAIAGLALIALLAYFLIRRRRRSSAAAAADPSTGYPGRPLVAEKPANEPPYSNMQQLSGETNHSSPGSESKGGSSSHGSVYGQRPPQPPQELCGTNATGPGGSTRYEIGPGA